jgi:tetratricopeptide (TPR) repeat protein
MKKTLGVYVLVLCGVFAVLFLLSREDEYTVEKKAWKLFQRQVELAKDHTVVPEQAFEELVGDYNNIISRYPDSPLRPGLHIRLGEIYLLKGDYAQARQTFYDVVGLYPEYKELSAESMFKIGRTYELSGHWVEAVSIYNSILKDYPATDTALNVPLYIAGYHKGRNDFQKTTEAYASAERFYTKTEADYAQTETGLNALQYLANCYLEQKRWEEAIKTLGRILESYAGSGHLTGKTADTVIKTINIVSAYQIRDYDAAIGLYQGIIDRDPGHPLRGHLTKVINAFRKLEEEGVQVADQE